MTWVTPHTSRAPLPPLFHTSPISDPASPHLQREDLLTAERCFGATGSVAKSRYLHKVNNMVRAVEAESPGVSGIDHFSVQ